MFWGSFPGSASGKEPTCQCGRHKRCGFDPWVGKIPWRRAWQTTPVFFFFFPLQYFLLENSQGQRSLAGYSPYGRKESDTTEVTEHARGFFFFLVQRKCLYCLKGRLYFKMGAEGGHGSLLQSGDRAGFLLTQGCSP